MTDQPHTAPLAYLATPYAGYEAGLHAAFIDAAKLTAGLMSAGVKVFSPIVHGHPIALYGNLDPIDHSIWIPFDEAMMKAATVLIIGKLDGWQESHGIEREVEIFRAAGKPIFLCNPHTLTMVRLAEPVLTRETIDVPSALVNQP